MIKCIASLKDMAFCLYLAIALLFQLVFTEQQVYSLDAGFSPYLETYPSDDKINGTPIHFALILSFPGGQFDSYGAIAGVRVALDRINNDPYLLQNYTLRYTLTNSSVSYL